jgi:hypothetical protein
MACRGTALLFLLYKHRSISEVLKLWGAPTGRGRCWSSVAGGSCLYEGHICFERNMGARQNIYFGRHFCLAEIQVSPAIVRLTYRCFATELLPKPTVVQYYVADFSF